MTSDGGWSMDCGQERGRACPLTASRWEVGYLWVCGLASDLRAPGRGGDSTTARLLGPVGSAYLLRKIQLACDEPRFLRTSSAGRRALTTELLHGQK